MRWESVVEICDGATTGELDEQMLFYLRSRGLNKEEAKKILIEGFVNELFENKDLGQEAKELIAMVDNPNAISKAMNAIKQILARVQVKQQPEQPRLLSPA